MHYAWPTGVPAAQPSLDLPGEARGPVVVGVDVSAGAVEAIGWALAHARSLHPTPEVVLAHVLDEADLAEAAHLDPHGEHHDPLVVARATATVLARIAREMSPQATVRTAVESGTPADALVAAAEHASLVVLGSRGRADMTTSAVGSVAGRVAAHARCPVAVVPQGARFPRAGRVVVGAANGPAARAALHWGADEAARTSSVLVLVHTAQTSRPLALDEVVPLAHDVLARHPGLDVTLVVAAGDPSLAVLRAARSADLVVLGCHHRETRFASRLGAAPSAVWPLAPCPVVLVPGTRRHGTDPVGELLP